MSTTETQPGLLSPRARAILVTYGLALVGFALGIGVILVLTIGYFAITGNETVSAVAELGMSLIALQGIAFPLLSLIYVRWSGHDWSFLNVKTPSLKQVGWAVLTFVGAFVLALIAAVVVQTLGLEAASNSGAETAQQNPEIIPYMIVAAILLIGPGEELLFRGVIQGTLREYFSAPAAILLASGAFAPLHIFALIGNLQAGLVTIAVLFIPSLAFGYSYERTQNLVVPAFAHGLYDALLFAFIYLATAYGPETQSLLVF